MFTLIYKTCHTPTIYADFSIKKRLRRFPEEAEAGFIPAVAAGLGAEPH